MNILSSAINDLFKHHTEVHDVIQYTVYWLNDTKKFTIFSKTI